jgi:hypothetical protein
MDTQVYKNASLGCFAAGTAATLGAIGTWIAGRSTGRTDLTHDGLFLGILGSAFLAMGNRLALASLDRAERVRWTGEDDADVGIGMATTFKGEILPQATPGLDADFGPVQSPRPLSHVSHGVTLPSDGMMG